MTAFPDFGQKMGFKGPSLSANKTVKTAVNHKFTAVLIFSAYKKPYKLQAKPRPIQRGRYHGKSGLRKSVR